MSEKKEQKADSQACSYITFNVVDWVDIFVRPVYKQIIVDELNCCIVSKGLIVYAWCLMSNHLHLLARNSDPGGLTRIERDFKRVTTNKILEALEDETDLRKDWMLSRFEQCSHNLKRIEKFQVWQTCVNPSFIDFKEVFKLKEKVLHIHENPVRDGIVDKPESYKFSSARDYAGEKGLVRTTVIDFRELLKQMIRT
ncbi:transposase [Pseudoflavitalea rhizosphaerae]|uniref:transposase n=1 Tax=Pseudoflavitalea rhizosphaerae TaxID=1884793 RepID=UPI000F8E20B1|nr:transposase [Pseudoflavitalea rhizosphaerae]